MKSNKLSDKAKLETWNSLFKSKLTYATEVLCYKTKNLTNWLRSFFYNSLRKIIGINSFVNQKDLFQKAYGSSWECWYDSKLQQTR